MLITVRPAASIPSAEDIFYALGKSKFRTSLDLKQDFWQNPIKEKDKGKKTAFGTDFGVYEFNRMAFGFGGAPAVFQNCINAVLGDIHHFALAFVDDIIVFSGDVRGAFAAHQRSAGAFTKSEPDTQNFEV